MSAHLTGVTQGTGRPEAQTTTLAYNGTQLTCITTLAGHIWQMGYDIYGRVASLTSPVSGTVGQPGYTPSYQTSYSYQPGQTTVTQGAGSPGALSTTYTLDAQGQVTAVADGLGHTSRMAYDQAHDVLARTDANGQVTGYAYQYVGPNRAIGLPTRMVEPPITPLSPLTTTTAAAVTSYRYDPSTYDLLETDLPADGVSKQTYNGHHDVASSALLITGTTAWQGSLSNYDSQANLTSSTDGRGVSVATNGSSVTPNAQASQYTGHQVYNAQGDQTAAGTPPITTTLKGVPSVNTPVTSTTGATPNRNSTTMAYDHLGRQTSTTLPPVALAGGGVVQPVQSTAYDGEDHVVQQVHGNGDITQSSYDPLGRLMSRVSPVSGTQINTYNATELPSSWDPASNPTGMAATHMLN